MTLASRKISTVTLRHSTRFVILALSIVCLSFLVSNSMALNFTIICMADDGSDSLNGTSSSGYNYSPTEQGWLFSIVAVGQILGTIALPYSISHFEVRTTFTAYGLISAVATLLTPLSAYIGVYPLLLMRLLQGFATSTSFTGMGSITSQWASIKESGLFLALLSCHLQTGNIFTMPVAGALCESSWGWPALYYLQGILTILCFALFYGFYRDDPYWHYFVSDKELNRIEKGKISIVSRSSDDSDHHSKPPPTPFKAIFSDSTVWGVVIGVTGIQVGYFLFVQFGPVYMNKVLEFDVRSTGFATALPHIVSIIIKIIAGPLSDHLSCVSLKTNVMIFMNIANGFLIFGIISLIFITRDFPLLAQISFIIVISFCGINSVGGMKAAQSIAQHHTHILMIIITMFTSIVILVLPVVVALVAPNNTHGEWKLIFIGTTIIVFICMIVFNIKAEVEPRPWVKSANDPKKVLTVPISSKLEIESKIEKDLEKSNE